MANFQFVMVGRPVQLYKLTLHAEPRAFLHWQAGSSQPGRGHLGPALSLGGRVCPRSTKPSISCFFKGKLSNGLLISHVVILGELQQQISWSMDVAPL